MVASLDPQWLYGAFSTLVCLFDRVGLWTNFGKIVGMVFRPFQVAGTQSEASYRQRMTGEGVAEGTGAFQGVQGEDSGFIIGGAQDDKSWESSRRVMDL